jgi:hypothetical protein
MNRYCWDPGFYTAFSFACVPTGDTRIYYNNHIYIVIYVFFFLYLTNKLHIKMPVPLYNRK